MKVPFVIYADFESIISSIAQPSNVNEHDDASQTKNVQKHIPCSFAYHVVCDSDKSRNKTVLYRGEDCAKVFIESIRNEARIIYDIYQNVIPLITPTKNELTNFKKTNCCHICEITFGEDDDIVLDHDHLTGRARGFAHNECNLKYQLPHFIPIFFHNLANYDSHLFMEELSKNGDTSITVIPQTKEKYITFSQGVNVDEFDKRFKIKLRFIDSYKFMASSLASLSNNLSASDFIETMKCFNPEDFNLISRKGVYPYEYMNSFKKFKETELPSVDLFYSTLTNTSISESDYKHAQDVWSHFKIKNMGEYSDLYLKTDVLLLSDVFEKFRKLCLSIYNLDCCWYLTAPSLSLDACLKYTKIELDLLSDIDMIDFIRKGIRGGISQCSCRFVEANNKYTKDYDSSHESNFLMYYDANNLYGWAMSQPLPYGNFEWIDSKSFNLNQINVKSDEGYILEVDLDYPTELHSTHNDLPFCVENMCPPNGKVPKLITNLNNKEKYIIHSQTLLQAIEHGLILKKIHRILKFNQSTWLKKYIDLNTHMRTIATNDFEKDFFKLMNNSIYGKTMENVDKRVNVKLVTVWGKKKNMSNTASKLISKPNFHNLSIFNENFVAIQMRKTSVNYNKPIYLGFVVLEMSKHLMYDFHYNHTMKKYSNSNQATLCYMDTDSFIYNIKTDDVYRDMSQDLDKFDTSNYSSNNAYNLPLVNKKVIGLMKDENGGKIMKRFVGLRSKLYSIQLDDGFETKKAKGIKTNVTNELKFYDYKNCLDSKSIIYKSMYIFKSIKHEIFTQFINKIALSSNDDKRYIEENGINTLAWGHHKIV